MIIALCLLFGISFAIGGCSKPEEKAPPKAPVAEKMTEPSVVPVEAMKETAEKVVEQSREMVGQVVDQTITVVKEQAEVVREAVRESVPEQHQDTVEALEKTGRAYLEQAGSSSAGEVAPSSAVERVLDDKTQGTIKLPAFK